MAINLSLSISWVQILIIIHGSSRPDKWEHYMWNIILSKWGAGVNLNGKYLRGLILFSLHKNKDKQKVLQFHRILLIYMLADTSQPMNLLVLQLGLQEITILLGNGEHTVFSDPGWPQRRLNPAWVPPISHQDCSILPFLRYSLTLVTR